ncbi:hypothetical protein LCGC14_0833620 [marine sediment metagenome]|uniref:Uncharacterized protein n=1 Tax=marine sediment metagenome TaxID=412755 RepID=A0A0F9PF89_9ZZZZ|nr:MAG: hypothetical protein Lokiarch_35340 [Candidatus Lokiarchaeum sp. GC14_75]
MHETLHGPLPDYLREAVLRERLEKRGVGGAFAGEPTGRISDKRRRLFMDQGEDL